MRGEGNNICARIMNQIYLIFSFNSHDHLSKLGELFPFTDKETVRLNDVLEDVYN